MNFQTKPLSKDFGAEVLDVDLTRINEDMAEAILSTVQKHALLYDNAQLLHKRDAYEGIRFLKATRLFLSPDRFAVPD